MSNRKVLDSFSLISFLENGPGADKVTDLIKHARDKDKPLFISVVSWGEAHTALIRSGGEQAAEKAVGILATLPIEQVQVDEEIAKIASEFCGKYGISYLDGLAAATAKQRRAQLVTGLIALKALDPALSVLCLE